MRYIGCFIQIVLVLICVLPFLFVGFGSIYNGREGISFYAYYQVFLRSSQYLKCFWRSVWICLCIVAGQVFFSTLAGYGFAKYEFAGKQIMFFLLLILMILPLQVTLIPNFIMLNQLRLLDTYAALILPGIFAPLGTFILTQSFRSVPNEIIDAAKLDGCGALSVLGRILLPMNKSGLACVAILSFLDSWNMVEQPMTYLKDTGKYPISVSLATASSQNPVRQLVCCVLVMVPPLLLFGCFHQEMVEGITLGEVK